MKSSIDNFIVGSEGPADLLAKIKTVDGAGSGLDADTVKGYVPVNKAGDTITGELVMDSSTNAANAYSRGIRFHHVDSGGVKRTNKVIEVDPSGKLFFSEQGVVSNTIWHSGNATPVNKAGDTMTGALLAPNLYSRRTMPGTDLNTVIAPGIYLLGANSAYANGAGMDYCVLEVHSSDDTGYIVQKVTQVLSPYMAKFRSRTEAAGGWGAWQQQWVDGNAPKSLAGNGYQKLPSGLIIQWGSASVPSGTTITLPIAFPTIIVSVTITPGSGSIVAISSNLLSTSNFVVNHGNGSTSTNINWMAIGY